MSSTTDSESVRTTLVKRRLVACARGLGAAIVGFGIALHPFEVRLGVAAVALFAIFSVPSAVIAVVAELGAGLLRSTPWWSAVAVAITAGAGGGLVALLHKNRVASPHHRLPLSNRLLVLLAGLFAIAIGTNAGIPGRTWTSLGDITFTWLGLVVSAAIALVVLNMPRRRRPLDKALWVAASFGISTGLLLGTVSLWSNQDDSALESYKTATENGLLTSLGGPMGAITNKTVTTDLSRTLPNAADLQQSLELAVSGQPSIQVAQILRIAPNGSISEQARYSTAGDTASTTLANWIAGSTGTLRQSADNGATVYVGLMGVPMSAGPDQPFLVFAAPMVDIGVAPGPGTTVDTIIAAVSIPNALSTALSATAAPADSIYTDIYMNTEEGSVLVWSTDPRRYESNSVLVGFPIMKIPHEHRAVRKVTTVSTGTDITIVVHRGPKLGLASEWRRLILLIEALIGAIGTSAVVFGIERGQRRERDRLRREALLGAALEGSPGWTAIIGPDFDIVMSNKGRDGVSAGMALADVDLFTTDIEGRRAIEDIIITARTGVPASHQLVWTDPTDPSHAIRIFEVDARPLPDPELVHLQCRDVTEHRDRAMRSAQSERMEAIGVLAGGLAHDFNNLLFITLGYLQMLERQPIISDDRTASAYVERAIEAVERGASVAKSLLSVARSQPLTAIPINLAEFLDGLEPLFEQALRGAHELVIAADTDGLDVVVDPGRLSSSLLNIAFNARDAMSKKGTVTIAARHVLAAPPDGDMRPMVAISVADTGKGMSPEVAARAFEPFFTTKKVGSGTGLGLATVYSFAQQSGGWATIESAEGVGTTVTVYLPPALESPARVTPESLPTAASTRALVVDDEPALAELVAAWLSDLHMTVKTANSPEAAMRIAAEFKPELLVSDANLGAQIDGLELARLLVERNPALLVVFMTGFSDRIRALQAAGVAVLAKPFTAEDLVNTLSLHLGERLRNTKSTGL